MSDINYTFGGGNHRVMTVNISSEMNERLLRMCNILEMSRSALARFLIKRGLDQLEEKLKERGYLL